MALLSERISQLSEHVKIHRKDHNRFALKKYQLITLHTEIARYRGLTYCFLAASGGWCSWWLIGEEC